MSRVCWALLPVTALWRPPQLLPLVDDLLVLLGALAEGGAELVDGRGGDQRAHDPPPLLQPHPHHLHLRVLPLLLAVVGEDRLHESPHAQHRAWGRVSTSARDTTHLSARCRSSAAAPPRTPSPPTGSCSCPGRWWRWRRRWRWWRWGWR